MSQFIPFTALKEPEQGKQTAKVATINYLHQTLKQSNVLRGNGKEIHDHCHNH
jgi:hypothetical protein